MLLYEISITALWSFSNFTINDYIRYPHHKFQKGSLRSEASKRDRRWMTWMQESTPRELWKTTSVRVYVFANFDSLERNLVSSPGVFDSAIFGHSKWSEPSGNDNNSEHRNPFRFGMDMVAGRIDKVFLFNEPVEYVSA